MTITTGTQLGAYEILTSLGVCGMGEVWLAEFSDGQTLRARFQAGTLPLAEALDVAVQIAAALAPAHEASIVHRDIKPENASARTNSALRPMARYCQLRGAANCCGFGCVIEMKQACFPPPLPALTGASLKGALA